MRFLNTQTKSVSFASLILAGSYLLSAVLGIARDRLLTGRFGLGNELDVYYSAFTVPDFIALILILGAISAAIIPIFSSYVVHSKEEAWQYVSNLLTIFLTFLIGVCLVLIIFAPWLVHLIAPGFSESKKEMTVVLMRIMFLSPIILGTSSIISGILQVFHRFLVTALAPIMYNLGIIIGILFFVPWFGLPGLAFGVVLGGLLHLAIQLPAFFHSGFRYKFMFNLLHPGVRRTLNLTVPRSIGLGAGQFNTMVITAIASTLVAGSVAVYNLANNLSSLLVNAVAVSLSTAIFPAMAQAFAREDKSNFETKFVKAFLQLMFLSIPISIGIFLLRAQIVRVFYGTGKFTWLDTRLTAACLGIFCLGLFAQGLIFLLSKTFYAAHNTKIPALISVATVAGNIIMSLLFIWLLNFTNIFSMLVRVVLKLQTVENISVVGLSLAFTITVICEALLLLFFIHKKLHIVKLVNILPSMYKILIAALVMVVIIWVTRDSLVRYHIINLQTFLGVFIQLAAAGLLGSTGYLVTSFLLKSRELHMIRETFLGK